MSSHCYIINLPEEILDLVYKYIPCMRDKLNLAKSHCVLGKAFAFHAGNTFKSITIEDRPTGEWLDILPLCGSFITSINIWGARNNVIVAKLTMHCPNVENICLNVPSSSLNQFKSLLLTLQNLSGIEIWKYSQNFSVVDTLVLMPKLKHLKLTTFNNHGLERVGELANLTKLNLFNDGEPIDIFKCCSPLKNINSLELDSAVFRIPKDLGGETLWPKIELLKVYIGIFEMPLPYLRTLKTLTIRKIPFRSLSDLFGESVSSYGKTLEALDIIRIPVSFKEINGTMGVIIQLKALKKLDCCVDYNDCLYDLRQLENLEVLNLRYSKLTNREAIMVIKGCTKLRHLNIRECYLVNSDMVEEVVADLQNSPPRSDKPFVLVVAPTFEKVDKSKLGGVLNIEYV